MNSKKIRKFYLLIGYSIFLIFLLVLLEIGSRFVLPVSPGYKKVANDGSIVMNSNRPSVSYYQVSQEFKKYTSIDERGYRKGISNNINQDKIVFLGDSFCFGIGLSDTETIPSRVSLLTNTQVVNLGIPGTGALRQKQQLLKYLNEPSNHCGYLVHLIFASTNFRHSGNDITDTFYERLNSDKEKINVLGKRPLRLKIGRWFTKKSNLFRIMRFYGGKMLHSLAWQKTTNWNQEDEFDFFVKELINIQTIAKNSNMNYFPVLVSSAHELRKGVQLNTVQKIQEKTGVNLLILNIGTDLIEDYYYPFDGHFNPEGAQHCANLIFNHLKSEDH